MSNENNMQLQQAPPPPPQEEGEEGTVDPRFLRLLAPSSLSLGSGCEESVEPEDCEMVNYEPPDDRDEQEVIAALGYNPWPSGGPQRAAGTVRWHADNFCRRRRLVFTSFEQWARLALGEKPVWDDVTEQRVRDWLWGYLAGAGEKYLRTAGLIKTVVTKKLVDEVLAEARTLPFRYDPSGGDEYIDFVTNELTSRSGTTTGMGTAVIGAIKKDFVPTCLLVRFFKATHPAHKDADDRVIAKGIAAAIRAVFPAARFLRVRPRPKIVWQDRKQAVWYGLRCIRPAWDILVFEGLPEVMAMAPVARQERRENRKSSSGLEVEA